jgi:RNA polymerase sigma factor (sigma-70 family)
MDDAAYREMDDAELVRRQVGRPGGDDRRAYAELVRRYGRLVYVECRGFLCRAGARRAQDADDLAQETLLRGLRDLATLHNPEVFADWVCAIARNVCRNWVARRDNNNRNFAPDDPEPPGRPDAGPRDDLLDLAEALGKLPDSWRRAILLRLDGCSHQEIADRLGVKPPTVNAWLTQARQLLRRLLNPPDDDADP